MCDYLRLFFPSRFFPSGFHTHTSFVHLSYLTSAPCIPPARPSWIGVPKEEQILRIIFYENLWDFFHNYFLISKDLSALFCRKLHHQDSRYVTQSYWRRNKIVNLFIDSDEKFTNEYWPLYLQFNPLFLRETQILICCGLSKFVKSCRTHENKWELLL